MIGRASETFSVYCFQRLTILKQEYFEGSFLVHLVDLHSLEISRSTTLQYMPQKWILLSSVICIFRKTGANSILVEQCSVFIADCDAQCNQKVRIMIIETPTSASLLTNLFLRGRKITICITFFPNSAKSPLYYSI